MDVSGFIKPVIPLVVIACWWERRRRATETMTLSWPVTRSTTFRASADRGSRRRSRFRQWIDRPDAGTQKLLKVLKELAGLIALMLVVRYFKETSNMHMSMDMVFHIRAAVYDKSSAGWVSVSRCSQARDN